MRSAKTVSASGSDPSANTAPSLIADASAAPNIDCLPIASLASAPFKTFKVSNAFRPRSPLAGAGICSARVALRRGPKTRRTRGGESGPRRAQRHGLVRDGLWAVRPAPYWDIRRSGPYNLGSPRLRSDVRRQDPPHFLFRRYGRPAKSAGQRAEPGDAG